MCIRDRNDYVRIDGALGEYMKTETGGRELEMGPADVGGWQIKDPKTGLTPHEMVQSEQIPPGPEAFRREQELFDANRKLAKSARFRRRFWNRRP